ncbi:uncharacterized protein METZ01_LOCUS301938, partial [marine metagenome]
MLYIKKWEQLFFSNKINLILSETVDRYQYTCLAKIKKRVKRHCVNLTIEEIQ